MSPDRETRAEERREQPTQHKPLVYLSCQRSPTNRAVHFLLSSEPSFVSLFWFCPVAEVGCLYTQTNTVDAAIDAPSDN
jgi:hypothetical protein